MTRFPWLTRAMCSTILLLGIGCGGKTHVVGSVTDGSAGGKGGGSGGTTGLGGTTGDGGAGGTMPKDAPVATGGIGGAGTGGTGKGGSGAGGTGTGAKPGTGGVIGNGGAPSSGGRTGTGGGTPPLDAGISCSGALSGCCYLDGECKPGFECAGVTCTAETRKPGVCEPTATLAAGQCWRDSDCPASSGSCYGAQMCPCGANCFAADQPGTCIGTGGTGGAIGTGGAGGGGGNGGVSDGGRPSQNPSCCSNDEECKEGYECAGGICEYIVGLTAGQCWRDLDCPASSGGCRGAGICGCSMSCNAPDQPGTCIGTGGTGGVIGTGGAGGGGGTGGAPPPVDGGRACQGAPSGCCFLDEDCRPGLECAGATCTAGRTQSPGICEPTASLTAGQCWRDSDCPAGSGGCVGAGICGCGSSCFASDRPGTCQ